MKTTDAVVLGLGEVGGPIAEILSRRWSVGELDIDRQPHIDRASIAHVCYPFQVDDFIKTTIQYVERYRPSAVVIHSTVVPRTTSSIQMELGDEVSVYFSPVRGKHRNMVQDMMRYQKFIAGPDARFGQVTTHLEEAGFRTARMHPPEALELAKLLETSYFGVLIAWAQDVERLAESVGADFETVSRFIEEIDFLPSGYFPGFIGGHCVMPNIDLIKRTGESVLLDAVKRSNERYALERGRG